MTTKPEPEPVQQAEADEPQVEPVSPPAGANSAGLAELSFLKCLERLPLGETWIVRTASGKKSLCQFLPPTEPEAAAALLERLQSFRHRNLAPWMVVRGDGNRLALLSPLEGITLRDRFQERWAAKKPGVSREELLGYLRAIAEALDLLQARHHVQHLWLHPRQLMVQEDRVQILNFGLVETIWVPTGRPAAELNSRYSAPELQNKAQGPHCDQYSLALIYAEMLTSQHPWRGRASGQAQLDPELGLLPDNDRIVLERALHPDPRKRFSSITEMVDALEEPPQIVVPAEALQPLLASEPPFARSGIVPCQTVDQFLVQLVNLAAGHTKTPDELKIRYTLKPGRHLEVPAYVGRVQDALPLFDDFCRQWHAKAILKEDGLIILAINAAPSMWHWLFGRRQGLEIQVRFLKASWGMHRADVVVKPFGCDPRHATQLLTELAPKLLHGLKEILHAQPEQRGRERLPVRERLQISPVVNGVLADPIECFTKDISAGGIGFYLPVEIPSSHVYVNLPEYSSIAPYSALAQVVRKKSTGDGWFEVGAAFPVIRKQ